MEEPIKSDAIRNPDGTFKVGNPGSPGRPKGKTLKEYAREYLMSLPDEEKLEYLKTLPKDIVWKMAEGNPKQDTGLTDPDGKDLLATLLVKFIDGNKTN